MPRPMKPTGEGMLKLEYPLTATNAVERSSTVTEILET